MQFNAYFLSFTGALHISTGLNVYDKSASTLESDSLSAAIMTAKAQLGLEIVQEPDYTISSLFPYATGSKGIVPFFPRPYFPKVAWLNTVKGAAKKVKKMKWVSLPYFERLIAGDEAFFNHPDLLKDMQGAFLSKEKIPLPLQVKDVPVRIRSNGLTEDAEPFYSERIYHKKGAGLYFLALFNSNEEQSNFEAALAYLADSGIGTDRSTGNGLFTWHGETIDLEIPAEAKYITTLGMYLPKNKEEWLEVSNDEDISFEWAERGGWVTQPGFLTYRKNPVNMLRPGAILKTPDALNHSIGRVADVTPQNTPKNFSHRIFRDGRTLALPINLANHE